MRLAGSARPEAMSAARTRSRLSATALSGRPTSVNTTAPGDTCTCTSTARASMPSKATVAMRTTMEKLPCNGESVAGPITGAQERKWNETRFVSDDILQLFI